jgi:hypothetical protein
VDPLQRRRPHRRRRHKRQALKSQWQEGRGDRGIEKSVP